MSLADWFARVRRSALPWYVGSDWLELAVIAAGFTLVMLVVLKLSRLGPRLVQIRRRMIAAVYVIWLYRRSAGIVILGELRLVANNLKYLLVLSPVLAVGAAGFALIYRPCADRYARRPVQLGSSAVVRVTPAAGSSRQFADCRISSASENLTVSARARIPGTETVWARLTARRAGVFHIRVGRGPAATAEVNFARPATPVRRWQYAAGFEVHVDYPPRQWWGCANGWMGYFLLACLVSGAPLGRWLGISL